METIRRWWNTIGTDTYPTASRLLITADGGGSNGSRLRLWKTELAALATETGPDDHRLPPPTRHQQMEQDRAPTVLPHPDELARPAPDQPRSHRRNHRAATTTRTGLTVHAELDIGTYPTGIKIPDQQMKDLETTPTTPPRVPRRLELHHAPRDTPEHTHLNQT